ncbi:hypothetical protein ACFOGJ_16185 [Marinibaculum pumilum]|uniref:Uncharacterized protein n=1 Tax=Marinibaculum pumilum TaxID=1766165 RepID=A0ABV7L2K3_9PROT
MTEVNEDAGTPTPEPAPAEDDDFASALAEALEGAEALDAPDDGAEGAGRTRDERGRFTKAEADDEGDSDGADDGADEDDEDSPDQDQTEKGEEPAVTPAPAHWSAEDKAWFETLNAQQRDGVLGRIKSIEAGFTPKLQEAAAANEFKRAFDNVVNPFLPMIEAEGGNPIAAVASLLQTAAVLRQGTPQQKAQLLGQVAQQFGISIDDIDEAPPVQRPDPVVAQLQQQVQQLRSGLSGFVQSQQQRERESIGKAWADFAASNDFAADLEADMARLIQSGAATGSTHAETLSNAYRMALATRDDLQQQVNAKREAERRKAEEAKAREAAEKARKAKGVPLKTGGKPDRPKSDRSLEEELAEQLANAAGYS